MNQQTCGTLMAIWRSDLQRHAAGRRDFLSALHTYHKCPGFQFLFWLRLAAATKAKHGLWRLLHFYASFMHKRRLYRYGISIPYDTQIGPGFFIGHFGGIVVNGAAVIGHDCNISHGVTIGQTNRGVRAGIPVIGDRVYIGPGPILIGGIRIGNDCAIGANAVVTHDLPDMAVAAGNPAKIISYAGSVGYVEHIGHQDE